MKKIMIRNISLLNEDNQYVRRIEVELSNGTVVKIEACHESWEQWGGTSEELFITEPIAEKCNEWLHEGLTEEEY